MTFVTSCGQLVRVGERFEQPNPNPTILFCFGRDYRERQLVGRTRQATRKGSLLIINTSYQKPPSGSGDYPDKLLYHQALN